MNFFALFGIGIELNDNNEIGVDYSFPFSENSFYSTDQDYNTNTHEGNIFSEGYSHLVKTILTYPRILAKAKTELRLVYFGLFLQLTGITGEDITESITQGRVLKIRYSKDPFGTFKDMSSHYR